MLKKRFCLQLLILISLFFPILACGKGTVTPSRQPTQANSPTPASSPTSTVQPQGRPFTIAVEYAVLGVGDTYAQSGLTYAKLQPVFSVWGNIEPERGRYEWKLLDTLVTQYQSAGFTGLQILLSAESPWASRKPPSLSDLKGDTFPKEEYLDDYAAFVTSVVERYDADGSGDMPGLRYPIHHYGIEREFTGYFPGSAADYLRLLRIAAPHIHQADSRAEVLLVALMMGDVFDDSPDKAEIERRLQLTPTFRKSRAEILTILAACDSYDVVDFHSLGDYTEIPPTTAWIRSQLAANGCGDKPIWIGDAFSMSALIGFGGFVPPIPFTPATLADRDQVVEMLKAIADPESAAHASAKAWLEAEMARGMVKKIVVSAAEGLRGINIGNLEDWKTGVPGVDQAAVPMLGTSMFMGMIDTTITQQKPGGTLPYTGQQFSQSRRSGDLRPAYYALQLVANQIQGFISVKKVDLDKSIWAYRFETPAGTVWVLWVEDGSLTLPGETLPVVKVNLQIDAESALVVSTPLERGQAQPLEKVTKTSEGVLELSLDPTPVFVRVTHP